MTTEGKGFKLLEEKIGKMISLIVELRRERDSAQGRIREKEQEIEKLEEEIRTIRAAEGKHLSFHDVRELLEVLQEEQMTIRDGIRGALRLINE